MIVGNDASSEINGKLLTHLDIPKIIYQYLSTDTPPSARENIFFVGSTEKWVYGKMTKEKKYLFIDDSKGTVLSKEGNLIPMYVRNEFQNYLNSLSLRFNRK